MTEELRNKMEEAVSAVYEAKLPAKTVLYAAAWIVDDWISEMGTRASLVSSASTLHAEVQLHEQFLEPLLRFIRSYEVTA